MMSDAPKNFPLTIIKYGDYSVMVSTTDCDSVSLSSTLNSHPKQKGE